MDVISKGSENAWLEACLTSKKTMQDLTNALKYQRLVNLIGSNERIVEGLLNICFETLDVHGVEMNEYKTEPSNLNEHLTLFVATVFEDLFTVC